MIVHSKTLNGLSLKHNCKLFRRLILILFSILVSGALKSIVLSQAVQDVHVHRQTLLTQYNSTLVEPSLALCHHYKQSNVLVKKDYNQVAQLSGSVQNTKQEVLNKLNLNQDMQNKLSIHPHFPKDAHKYISGTSSQSVLKSGLSS